MSRLESALSALKQRVLDMAGLAESMVTGSWRGIVRRDAGCRARTVADEPALDRFQVELDREVVHLITIFTPVARDLRCLLMTTRIISELERIGDQAVDNCECADLIGDAPLPSDLVTLSEVALDMVHQAIEAIGSEDARQAESVLRLDARVDEMYSRLLLSLVGQEAGDSPASAGLVLLARSMERIADHATNVCEEVFYLVEGEDVRHRSAMGG